MTTHPPLYVYGPSGRHTDTLILLHGTSQTGPSFASSLIDFPFSLLGSESKTLRKLLNPGGQLEGLRVVFPTGSPKRMTVFDGKEFNAWFDIHSFSDRTTGEEGQIVGIRESLVYLGDLIRRERELLDYGGEGDGDEDENENLKENKVRKRGKVILGGFSQGTAIGMVGLLSGELEVDAFFGMSGWLPFRRQAWEVLDKFIPTSRPHGKLQRYLAWMKTLFLGFLKMVSWLLWFVFGRWVKKRLYTDEEYEMIQRRDMVLRYYRTLLSLPQTKGKVINPEIPTLISHGREDVKVKLEWSVQMREVMRELGWNMRERDYIGVEHWYCEDGLRDLVGFLREVCN